MALTSTEEALVRQLIDQQAAILSLAGSESTIISKLGATKVTIADLTSASSIADADLFLIRQGTTEKNVSGAVVKALASASVAGATETTAGIVELATAAETQTGTDNSRAVHPAGLSSMVASETLAGLIEIATDAEARAYTAGKAIDGAKLASAMTGGNQSLSTNGYQKLPGGVILQWGVSTSGSATFPVTFPNAVLQVIGQVDSSFGTSITDTTLKVTSITTSGFSFGATYSRWFAIGH